ncbi:MAG: DHH family phosphoesterase, partial [Lachnospiraceae bacterium]|nr:DHH family phosphoesterase [Lachnospiraceae bacterium]
MKTKMRIKGRLRTYLRFTIYLGILLLVIDIAAFTINRTAGWLLAVFSVVYIAVTLILYFYNKPLIMNELVSFATEYGQIQRKLLRELNLPYALLDE